MPSVKKIIKAGDGTTFPKPGDKITMHYVGTLESGAKFDSSRDRGQPFIADIGVGRLIRGWDILVPQMSLGEIAKLTIPAEEGYGARGVPGVIPGGATLIFEVELLGIN
ncbi:FK506 binding protein proline rotamase rapamycin-binding protein [Actinomortierella wolfii]|nr:FK506 binding protein proline rotamase rapamycin-binding protein [Actinomortierella wolfii]